MCSEMLQAHCACAWRAIARRFAMDFLGSLKKGADLGVAASLLCISGLGAGASYAAGDAVKGKAAFVRQCAICHTTDKDGANAYGPNLFGILGKRAGSAPNFNYSRAFRTIATFDWSEGLLGPWISLPST